MITQRREKRGKKKAERGKKKAENRKRKGKGRMEDERGRKKIKKSRKRKEEGEKRNRIEYDLGKNYSYTYSCLYLPFKTFFLQKPHELLKLEKKIFKMSAVPLP